MTVVTRNASAQSNNTGWTNPANLLDQDDDAGTYTIAAKNTTGTVLRLDNFGFDGVIPAGATINSVTVEVRQQVSGTGGVAFLENRLVLSGVNGATNSDGAEPTALTTRTYSNYARPGGGSWTRADLLDGTLYAQIWARSGNNATSVVYSFAYLRITVDYSLTPTFKQGKWRWYTDATPDGSMTALAAEGTQPTLTAAQVQNGIIRLRVGINETGGAAGTTGALAVQYSQDGTNWATVEVPGGGGDKGIWARIANGAATNGNTIGTRLLSDTTASGKYHEDLTATETISASSKHEVDFTLLMHWPPPTVVMRFRITSGGTPIDLDTGESQITVQSASLADRPYSLAVMDGDPADTADPETIWAGMTNRVWYDPVGARWWVFYVDFGSQTTIKARSWPGTGTWSSATTTTLGASAFGGMRNQHYLKVIGGTPVVMSAGLYSSGSVRLRRARISGSTITYEAEQTGPTASTSYGAVCCDYGNYWWIAWATSTTLFAARATTADDGSLNFTTTWQTAKSLTDADLAASATIAVLPLDSDKVLVVYYAPDVSDLKAVVCTDAGGFGTPVTVNTVGGGAAACNLFDWGAVRDGGAAGQGYVYVVHTTSASDFTGTYEFKVYSVSGDSWAAGPSPNISMTTGSDDMCPLAIDTSTNTVYMFRTANGPEGNEDRTIEYESYSGPGSAGTWSNNIVNVSPGSRGNIDSIGSSPTAAGGKIIVISTFGDDHLMGSDFALEYFTVNLSTGVTATVNLLTVGSSVQAAQGLGGADTGALGLLSTSPTMQAAQGLGGAAGVGGLLTASPTMYVAEGVGHAVVGPTSLLSASPTMFAAEGLGGALGEGGLLSVLTSLYAATAVESTDAAVSLLTASPSLYAAQGVGHAVGVGSLLEVLTSLYVAAAVGHAAVPVSLLSLSPSLYAADAVGHAVVGPTSLLSLSPTLYAAEGLGSAVSGPLSLLSLAASLYAAEAGAATVVPVSLLSVTSSLHASGALGEALAGPLGLLSVGSSLLGAEATGEAVGIAGLLTVGASMLGAEVVGHAVVGPTSLLAVGSSMQPADVIIGEGVLVGLLTVGSSLYPSQGLGEAVSGPLGLLTVGSSLYAAQGLGGLATGPLGLLGISSTLHAAAGVGHALGDGGLLTVGSSLYAAEGVGGATAAVALLTTSLSIYPSTAAGAAVVGPLGLLSVSSSMYPADAYDVLLIPVALLTVNTTVYPATVEISEAVLVVPFRPSVGGTRYEGVSIAYGSYEGLSEAGTRYNPSHSNWRQK